MSSRSANTLNMSKSIEGIVVVLVTPLKRKGELSSELAVELIERFLIGSADL